MPDGTSLEDFASQAAPASYIEPDDDFANAIVGQESGGRGGQTSPTGARGLWQVEPDTAKEVAKRLGVDYDADKLLHDDDYNAKIGRRYLGEMLGKYGGDRQLAAAAYNAGPQRVDDWINGGAKPNGLPDETNKYVPAVMGRMKNAAPQGQSLDDFAGAGQQATPDQAPMSLDDFASGTPAAAAPAAPTWGEILTGAVKAGLVSNIQAARQTVQAATGQPIDDAAKVDPKLAPYLTDPYDWSLGLPNFKKIIGKNIFGLAESAPQMAGAIAGGAAGVAAVGGPENPLAIISGPVGAGLGAAGVGVAKSLAPIYAEKLKANPGNPDAAFSAAWKEAAQGGAFTGLAFGAFGLAPFQSSIKNVLLQAFAVQPAIGGAEKAVTNVQQGRPAGEGVGTAAAEAGAGTLIPMVPHLIRDAITGKPRPAAPGETPGDETATPPDAGPWNADGSPAAPGAPPAPTPGRFDSRVEDLINNRPIAPPPEQRPVETPRVVDPMAETAKAATAPVGPVTIPDHDGAVIATVDTRTGEIKAPPGATPLLDMPAKVMAEAMAGAKIEDAPPVRPAPEAPQAPVAQPAARGPLAAPFVPVEAGVARPEAPTVPQGIIPPAEPAVTGTGPLPVEAAPSGDYRGVASDALTSTTPAEGGPVRSVPAETTPHRDETQPTKAEVDTLAAEAHPAPTPEQAEAGNYQKGHVKIHGLDVAIENAEGDTRRGVGADGKPWESAVPAHYGYIKRTKGADGEHVDTYIGPDPQSTFVAVVDQHDPATGKFDETKVILGTHSLEEATALYDKGFSDGSGPSRRARVTPTTVGWLKEWLKSKHTKEPFGIDFKVPGQGDAAFGNLATSLKDLRQQLDAAGFPNVALHMVDKIDAGGGRLANAQRIGNLIRMAIDTVDQKRALNHEIVHLVRDQLAPAQWKALQKAARIAYRKRYKIDERYGHLKLPQDRLDEEAVADAYSDWAAGKLKPTGLVAQAFDRIRQLVETLATFGRRGAPSEAAAEGRATAVAQPVFKSIKKRAAQSQRPDSLADWLSNRGGVKDTGGELRTMGAEAWHRGAIGRKKLVTEDGVDPDYAREAAAEAGYLPSDAHLDDLYQALDREMRGSPVYTEEGQGQADAIAERKEMLAHIDRMGGGDARRWSDAKISDFLAKHPGKEDEAGEAMEDEIARQAKRLLDGIENDRLRNDVADDIDLGEAPFSIRQAPPDLFSQPERPEDLAARGRPPAQGEAGRGAGRPGEGDRQAVIPGAEAITDRELAERRMAEAKRGKVGQKAAGDLPLFSGEHKQGSLFSLREPPAQADVQGLAADLKKRFALDSLSLYQRKDGDLVVNSITVPAGKRKQGVGSAVMNEITKFADERGVRTVLSPDTKVAGGATSRGRLVDFYKRFGFVENRGRNKDFRISEGMYRNPSSSQFSLRDDEKHPVFYSALTRAAEALPQAKGSPEQMLAMLRKGAGVKQEELDWSGVADWLKQQKGPVTKAALADFLRANELQVSEVHKGEPQNLSIADAKALLARGGNLYAVPKDSPNEVAGATMGQPGEIRELLPYIEKYPDKYFLREGNPDDRISGKAGTKFGTYVLPGGENYREMLLTLPRKSAPEFTVERRPAGFAVVRSDGELRSIHPTEATAAAEAAQYNRLIPPPGDYKSPHWDEPNVVAHIRMNDRTSADGKRTLHVEELQSDLHQKARSLRKAEVKRLVEAGASEADAEKRVPAEFGYAEPKPWVVYSQDTNEVLSRHSTQVDAEAEMARRAASSNQRLDTRMQSRGDTVPDAPFKTTWPELAMKRVLRYAAENGYDRVTWTPGEKQAERYDLSKHLKSIEYEPSEKEGEYEIIAYDHAGKEVIREDEVPLSRIEDLVGKEMAEKIRDDKGEPVTERPLRSWRRLSGLDLKVGGEGMKKFYDQMLPAKVNALVKRWGARVGETTVVHLSPEGEGWRLVNDEGETLHGGFATEASAKKFQQLHSQEGLRIARPHLEEYEGAKVHSVDINDAMRRSVLEGQPQFSLREGGALDRLRRGVAEKIDGFRDGVLDEMVMAAAPMGSRRGSDAARAVATEFQSAKRKATFFWNLFDDKLKKTFSPDQRRAMWDAMDEQSVAATTGAIRQGEVRPGIGWGRLTPDQLAMAKQLDAYASRLWGEMQAIGMVKGPGLAHWTPRMLVRAAAGEGMASLKGDQQARVVERFGTNVRTTHPSLLHRKYLTAAETEAAAQHKLGPDVMIARDVRAMPNAMHGIEDALAGRKLIKAIKELSAHAGEDVVVEDGVTAEQRPRFFTLDHPAFKTWRTTTDENGNKITRQQPLYIRKDFEGPLRAILTKSPGEVYQGMMRLKGGAMSMIMYSPLIHNAVEWGRALPLMPGKVFTFRVYGDGAKALRDPEKMKAFFDHAGSLIGHQGHMQDISDIMSDPNVRPGRGLTAQAMRKVIGLMSEPAGDAVARMIDTAGDVWHNKLLWDQVAKLQMGIFSHMREQLRRDHPEMTQDTADWQAAHLANRFAGALPMEAMSQKSRQLANLALFSRTFTLGNLGVFKDVATGLPKNIQSSILQAGGELQRQLAVKTGRKIAVHAILLDVGLMVAANSIVQDVIDYLSGPDKGRVDKIAHNYVDRAQRLMQTIKGNPLEVLDPFALVSKLGPGGDNEPGKEDYILTGYDPKGTAIYAKSPVGKMGMEFGGWMHPIDMLMKKTSTFLAPLEKVMSNSDGFGRPIFDPDDRSVAGRMETLGKIAWTFVGAQFPTASIQAAWDLMSGAKNSGAAALKTFGPVAGVTFSQGFPGGPAAGEVFMANKEQQYRWQQASPAIRRQIQEGDLDGAIQRMRLMGLQRYQIAGMLKHTINPSALSPRAIRAFMGYASDEDKARLQRLMGQ